MQTVWHFGYFWPVVVYLELKIMYRSGKIQWWPCKIELKHTKTKAKTKNKEETLVSAIFGPIVTKWIPKSVYFCRSKQWWSHIKRRKTKPNQAQTNNLAKKHMFFLYILKLEFNGGIISAIWTNPKSNQPKQNT